MNNTVVEFAISLIFFYLLLSAVCSAVQELLANGMRWRAKGLEDALGKLLGGSGDAQAIFNHPLLVGLKSPRWLRKSALPHNPSYIPTESFARALLDLRETTGGLSKEAIAIVDKLAPATVTDFDKRRAAVEKWFDDSMDRVSGWYKRTAHAWLWVIAVVVCIALNADSLRLAKVFWSDGPLRQSLVTAAEATVKDNEQTKDQQVTGDKAFENVRKAAARLEGTTIPLGWCTGAADVENDPDRKVALVKCRPLGGTEKPGGPRSFPPSQGLPMQFLGVLVTALAVSQGAPFWFDLLQKMVNIRLAGQKPGEKK